MALSSGDVPELKSTQEIDRYAGSIVTAISTAVDKAIRTYSPPQSLTYLLEAIKHLKSEAPLVFDLPCSMPGHLVPDTASLCGGE